MDPINNKYLSVESVKNKFETSELVKTPELFKNPIPFDLINLNTEASIYKKELEVSKLLVSEGLTPLETGWGKIEGLLTEATSFDQRRTAITQDILKQMAEKWVKKIIDQGKIDEEKTSGKDPSVSLLSFGKEELEEESSSSKLTSAARDNSVDLAEQLNVFLQGEGFFQNKVQPKVGVSEVDLLTGSVAVITSLMLLGKIKELIASKEISLEHLTGKRKAAMENEIVLLKKWTSVQSDLFNDLLKEAVIMSALSLPSGVATIVGLANATNCITGGIFNWIGIGVTLIPLALNWRKAATNLSKHEAWTEVIKSGGTSVEEAKKIVDRQRDIFNKRLKKSTVQLNSVIDLVKKGEKLPEENQKEIVEQAVDQLKEIGIKLSIKKPTLKDLQIIFSNPWEKEQFQGMMITQMQTKEALSVSLRNSLKTLANKKDQIDRGFFQLALNQTKGIFTVTAVLTALGIAIKTLIAVGLIASTVALGASGIGLVALVAIITLIGAVYLYVKKPNIFKTYLNGMQLKLLFSRIPLAIYRYKRNYKLFQTSRTSEEIHTLACRVLEIEALIKENKSEKIRLYLEKHALSKKKLGKKADPKQILANYKASLIKKEVRLIFLAKKLESLNRSVEKFEKKVKTLQEEIDKAGWKDFQRQLQKEKNSKIKELKKDEAEILAEYLLKDGTLLEDTETKKILRHLEIDLRKMKKKFDPKLVRKEIAKAIRSFFAMEETATIKLIDQQNLMEKHGLY